uniref:Tumor protein p53 binding protein, 2a n=1 Tax=Oncorhynchus mykiss TaxID=8022 RepID=A0A8C7NCT5_ONCMY
MFLTVYLSNNDQHFTEVPVTPETLCRDVVELCKEPGETECHLAEMWRGSERPVGVGERMLDVLQHWGQHRAEVRFYLRHDRAPSRESGEQQQQQASDQEKLRRLRENVENQETRLKKVRALKGHVEQKRLSNGKLVEEIEQMNGLFQQKQRELVVAVSKVEELNRQLEMLKNGKMDGFKDNQSSVAELDHLYKELQLRNKLNQEQNAKLQHQRDSLNKRNLEVASMDKRVSELRDRLWKKKAALQQKENLPLPSDGPVGQQQQQGPSRVAAVGPYIQSSTMPRGPVRHELLVKPAAYPDGTATLPDRVVPLFSLFVSSCYVMVTPAVVLCVGETEGMKRDRRVRPFSMFEPTEVPASSLRKNQSSDDLVRDAQSAPKAAVKVPPPVASKPKAPSCAPYGKPGLNTGTFPKAKPPSQQQHPQEAAKARVPLPPSQSQTLPLPSKQDPPLAATVRPFTPELPKDLSKPQTLAASSIYSMYTQQPTPGKPYPPAIQGSLNRSQSRGNGFVSVYGKPVISGGGPQQPENPYSEQRHSPDQPSEVDHGAQQGPPTEGQQGETERTPRPLSPTKLLPFISNPYRHQSDGDLEALRKKLYNAPRPLKKRSSITEPEGPAGPNIQKLLYQKTTLAAMETILTTPTTPEAVKDAGGALPGVPGAQIVGESSQPGSVKLEQTTPPAIPEGDREEFTPPPHPPHPAPRPDQPWFPPPPPAAAGMEEPSPPSLQPPPESFMEEFPPYPPPPYPSGAEQEILGEDTFSMQAPEVTGQVTLPPGKRTNLRKTGSERIDHSMRVKFNPLALLLDSSLEGEFDLVQRIIYEVEDPSLPNDEGITALHNAVCAGHTEIVKFLVQFGVNVNAADSDGWTPLHCAASCNNVQVCKFLVESGAAVFAMTYSDMQTAADKCEEMEEGYTQCSQFLYGVQEKMGIMNRGVVYGLWDYSNDNSDELAFHEGDCMTIVRREDEDETEWWWAGTGDTEGYIPRNLLGVSCTVSELRFVKLTFLLNNFPLRC